MIFTLETNFFSDCFLPWNNMRNSLHSNSSDIAKNALSGYTKKHKFQNPFFAMKHLVSFVVVRVWRCKLLNCTSHLVIVITTKRQKSACLLTFHVISEPSSLIFILLCLAHDLNENNSHRDLLVADTTAVCF